jgi:hypothetical protein
LSNEDKVMNLLKRKDYYSQEELLKELDIEDDEI